MEWIKDPNDRSSINPASFCVVRVCTSKKNCSSYICAILVCGKNAKRIL